MSNFSTRVTDEVFTEVGNAASAADCIRNSCAGNVLSEPLDPNDSFKKPMAANSDDNLGAICLGHPRRRMSSFSAAGGIRQALLGTLLPIRYRSIQLD
jgi:hypothetical protein